VTTHTGPYAAGAFTLCALLLPRTAVSDAALIGTDQLNRFPRRLSRGAGVHVHASRAVDGAGAAAGAVAPPAPAPVLVVWSLDDRVGVVTVRYRQVARTRRRLVPWLVPRKSIMLEHSNEFTCLSAALEPPIGIEPMTYALRGACDLAAHALTAPMAPVIAPTALAALGLSDDPVHEPVHAPGLRPVILLLCVTSLRTLYPGSDRALPCHEPTVLQIAATHSLTCRHAAGRSTSPRIRQTIRHWPRSVGADPDLADQGTGLHGRFRSQTVGASEVAAWSRSHRNRRMNVPAPSRATEASRSFSWLHSAGQHQGRRAL